MYYLTIKNTHDQEIEFVFKNLDDVFDIINDFYAKGEILLFQIVSDEFWTAIKKGN